jgi:hypothetical protein
MAQPRYNPVTNQFVRVDTDNPAVQQLRVRVTLAQLNAGLTLLAAVPGFAYRLISAALIPVGGAVTGATDVRLLGTRAAGSVALIVAAVAGLTQSAIVESGDATSVVLADGASFTPLDANTAITIGKTGGAAATATAVDVLLLYALE